MSVLKTAHAAIAMALTTLVACSPEPQSTSPHAERNHFFASVAPPRFQGPVLKPGISLKECEQNLKRAACSTNANQIEIEATFSKIRCGSDSASYVPALMKLVLELPQELRPEMCALYRVFISDRIESIAFASTVRERDGQLKGAYLGFRKSTFIKQPTSREVMSWKEQLSFQGPRQFLKTKPELVQVDYKIKTSVLPTDGLFYILVHELGHLIDARHNIYRAGQWANMSWEVWEEPLDNVTFTMRDGFCFYDCANYIPPHRAPEIYRSLAKSGFVTTYAALSPGEDFAEFFAWYVMTKFKSPNYQIAIPGQPVLDMNRIFTTNPMIMQKLDFIDSLWKTKLQIK